MFDRHSIISYVERFDCNLTRIFVRIYHEIYINQQRSYLPDTVYRFMKMAMLQSGRVWFSQLESRVFLEPGYRFPGRVHLEPIYPTLDTRISITYLYNSRGSMKPTFQDLSSTSYASSPSTPCWPLLSLPLSHPPSSPLPVHSTVSPFHPPYTVSPILINFTNPDGKSGLWQAGCHHEASTKLRLSAIGFLYLSPQLYAACVAAPGWGEGGGRAIEGTTRLDTTRRLPCLVSRGGIRVYRVTRHQINACRIAASPRIHHALIRASLPSNPPST